MRARGATRARARAWTRSRASVITVTFSREARLPPPRGCSRAPARRVSKKVSRELSVTRSLHSWTASMFACVVRSLFFFEPATKSALLQVSFRRSRPPRSNLQNLCVCRMHLPSSLFLLACLLPSASSLPLFSSATSSSRTTATKGADGGGSSAEPLAEGTRGENQAKAPHCRDTKAGCHAAKIKARAKKAAKLPAEQAETKKQNRTTTLPTFAGLSAAMVAKHKLITSR